jgi:signal transduction histidine kinase
MRKNLVLFSVFNFGALIYVIGVSAYFASGEIPVKANLDFILNCASLLILFIMAVFYFVFCLASIQKMIQQEVISKIKESDLVRMKMVENARRSSLGAMASGVAHEVNNPLAIIMGHVEQIRRHLFKNKILDDKMQRYFKTIESSSERINKVTKSLRFIAHEGEAEEFQMISIRELINKVLDLTLNRTTQFGIEFEILYSDEEDLHIECRESLLGHVLLIMITNSIEAIKDNGGEKWIHLFIGKGGFNEFKIRIVDSGFGIQADIRDKIFEPFFTTRDVNEGAGLGLSIALGIIKEHQGTIIYQSNEKHTTFDVIIPLQQIAIDTDIAA